MFFDLHDLNISFISASGKTEAAHWRYLFT